LKKEFVASFSIFSRFFPDLLLRLPTSWVYSLYTAGLQLR
jgi:hypothetical protein